MTKSLVVVLIWLVGVCFAIEETLSGCKSCSSCSNRATCGASGQCGSQICPSLAAAFASSNRTLIMKILITRNFTFQDQISYLAEVAKIYQGSGSGNVVEILPQKTGSPCFTPFLYDWYLVASPYNNMKLLTPECFYIFLNQCDYFKLWANLTAAEKAILAQHS
jgi:hypothetical protein